MIGNMWIFFCKAHGNYLPSLHCLSSYSLKIRYEWLAKFARERLAALPKQPKPLSILDDPESPPEFVDPNACFKVGTKWEIEKKNKAESKNESSLGFLFYLY